MNRRDFTITQGANRHVLRDDLLAGGTKRRGLDRLISTMPDQDFVYAGTIFGHGALAMALACKDHGKTAHLFLAANDREHPMLRKLKDAGAIIHSAEPKPIEEQFKEARRYAVEHKAYCFPLAFDNPQFQQALVGELQKLDVSLYPEIWCVSVSGTFAKALETAFPAKRIRTVSVVAGNTADFTAPEKYHKPAAAPPPYPACPYTDAKLWQFVERHGAQDALIWNIAG